MVSAACLAAAGMVLAGCGSGGGPSTAKPTVASLVRTVKADFRQARSLRMSGHLREHGHPIAIDLRMLRSGDIAGTVEMGGAVIRIVRVGSKAYAYVSRSFFRYLRSARHVPASACSLICGRYVSLPAGALPKITLAHLAAMMDKHVSVPKGKLHMSVTTFAGQPAYEVADAGQDAFFAKNGHHYLIGYRSTKQHLDIALSQWNRVPPISPPPVSKIVHVG